MVVFELALSRLDLPSPAHDHVVLEPLSNAFSLYSEHDLVVNGNGGCGMCLDGSGVSGVCLIVDGVESSLETELLLCVEILPVVGWLWVVCVGELQNVGIIGESHDFLSSSLCCVHE